MTFGFGALAMVLVSRLHKRGLLRMPWLLLSASGFICAALIHGLPAVVTGFSHLPPWEYLAALPMFWSLAASRLTGKAAGAAIALVNSVGAVGAFAGPFVMGWLHDETHGYTAGLWAIAGSNDLGAALLAPRTIRNEHPR